MCRITFIISLVIICAHTVLGLSGSGIQEDPWLIQSLEDFNDFAADANYWDGYTRLETDVNLAGLTYTTAVIAPDTDNSNDSFDGTFFEGSFDGNGKRIFNLTIQGGANDYLGLFGCIIDGIVRNLGLEGCDISGDDFVGSLVGENFSLGFNINCYSTGSVSGDDYVGGLVGRNYSNCYIGYCHSSGSVIGDEYVGGLVGINSWDVSNCCSGCYVYGGLDAGGLIGINSGFALHCYSIGYVSGYTNTGGLVGENGGTISKCFSTDDVNGDWFAGGLVGCNVQPRWGNGIGVSNCYSTGDVDGYHCIGGLVGINGQEGPLGQEPGYIHNSYSTGTVNGFSGGLVAIHVEGDIEGSFWDTQTSGQLESAGGTGKTTADMKKQSTFTDAGWDFEEIWDIGEKQTYPYLRQYLSADLNHDGSVNMLDFAIFAGHWLEGAG